MQLHRVLDYVVRPNTLYVFGVSGVSTVAQLPHGFLIISTLVRRRNRRLSAGSLPTRLELL